MDLIDLRDYCLSFPFSEETTPFDETTLVFKVAGKMFAVTDIENPETVVVKCDPDRAVELRELHDEITGAFHFNKKHWNAIRLSGDLPASMIREMITDSYLLVVSKMPRAAKNEIMEVYENREA